MKELLERLANLEQNEQNENLVWDLAFTLDKLGIISDKEYFAIIGTQK